MVWKSERKRSVTFRKRVPRQTLGGWNLAAGEEAGSGLRVVACMALIMPARRGNGLVHFHNWAVLVRAEVIARALAASRDNEDDDGSKQ
jgi:hypothetical protein